ncbi:MAG: gfo/Idh/MocA family oxidoreductase [Alphaproteobacteria bacterium]|nr:gfo/Idh/MocA family oxidoreductase [Alphaproteobacteria bacterium]
MGQALIDALILGCGRIAGGYDKASEGMPPRTHAGAYAARGDVRLLACVEPDPERRKAFASRWNVAHAFEGIADLRASGLAFDVASLCTPDDRHAADLEALLDVPVRAVLAEKPLAIDAGDAARVVTRYRAAGRALAVAYLRRWDPSVRNVASRIASGEFGAPCRATAFYGKGLMHNGSHMIDLLRLMLGPIRPVGASARFAGPWATDPTLDAVLEASGGAPIHLFATDHGLYDLFEVTLVFERAVVELREGAGRITVRPIAPTPGFAGHFRPDTGVEMPVRQPESMGWAIDNLIAHVRHGEALACDGETALETLQVCSTLRDSVGKEH